MISRAHLIGERAERLAAEKAAEDMRLISEMMFQLAPGRSLNEAAEVILQTAMKMLPSKLGYIVLEEGTGHRTQLTIAAHHPLELECQLARLTEAYRQGRGVVYHVITRRKPFCGDVASAREHGISYVACREDIRAEIAVPMTRHSQITGAINLESSSIGAYSAEDVDRLNVLASYAALTFHNVRLVEFHRRMRKAGLDMFRKVNKALDEVLSSGGQG